MAVMEAEVQRANTEAAQMGFDYAQIDEGIRDEVKDAAAAIHAHSMGVIGGIVAIGKRLIEVKGMLAHGQFTNWIEAEFDLSERTAQNYMNVAREYGDPQKRNAVSLFSPKVAYLLAAPSTPEEARAEVEQAAAEGQRVTVEFAKEAIRKAKPEPVQYSSVSLITNMVVEWLYNKIGEGGSPTPDAVLHTLELEATNGARSFGGWLNLMSPWLAERGVTYRDRDLIQAIKNVREQRRTKQRQAEARAVYVEPVATPPADVDPIVTNLIEANTITMRFTDSLRIATLAQLEAALAQIGDTDPRRYLKVGMRRDLLATAKRWAEPEPKPDNPYAPRVTKVEKIDGVTVHHMQFAATLPLAQQATDDAPTPDELAAIAIVEAEVVEEDAERAERDRQRASFERVPDVVAPDPRIAQASDGITSINAARIWVRDNYHDLTGMETDTLAFWRDTAMMLARLESLVGILGKGKP